MDALPLPGDLDDVAVVGAVTSMDEAVQMHQMRFILMWAMRVQRLAPGEAPPVPQAGGARSASSPSR